MATQYGSQAAKMFGQVTPGVYEQAKGMEVRGKVRNMLADYVVPAGGAAINDVIVLGVLPKGYRALGGFEWHEAMSTGAGAATGQIGVYTRDLAGNLTVVDDDLFQAAVTYDAAGQNAIGETRATGLGGFATSGSPEGGSTVEHVVALKVTVEAFAAGARGCVFLKYIAPDN